MTTRLTLLLPFLVGAVLAGAPVARADGPTPGSDTAVEEAKKYYEAGREAFDNAQYPAAIAALEEAYRLAPRASVKFSLGKAYRFQFFIDQDLGKAKRALALFREYVAEVNQGSLREEAVQYIAELSTAVSRAEPPPAPPPPTPTSQPSGAPAPVPVAPPPPPPPKPKTELMVSSRTPGARATIDGGPPVSVPVLAEVLPGSHKAHVESPGFFPEDVQGVAVDGRLVVVEVNLREKPAQLDVTGPAGAAVSVDGKPAGTLPLAKPISVGAGKHFLAVTQRGHYSFTREVALDKGATLSVGAKLQRTSQRALSYWVLGGAVLVGVAGGGATIGASLYASKADDIDSARTMRNITPQELADHNGYVSNHDDLTVASEYLYGGAMILAAAGVLMYVIDSPRIEAPSESAPSTTIAPAAGDHSFGVNLITRF